jgi:catechol 2,3-dioxygenase-like lactoylglutathione lyase family enzyme
MTANAGAGQKKVPMFKDSKAFSSFSVRDLQKAKEFYGERLGLEVTEMPEGLQLRLARGHAIFLYPKPNHEPASFTVLNFSVNDIDAAVAELKSLGIKLEHYDQGDIKTDEKGIFRSTGPRSGPTIAWFKDPDGNILSVLEDSK